jgi:BioD-like phosphotransacetylase family protein
MRPLYIVGTERNVGKTTMSLGLLHAFRHRGLKVGYLKPVGNLPTEVHGVLTDEDALFIAQTLGAADEIRCLCPVLLTPEYAERVFKGEERPDPTRVREAFDCLARGREVMIVGGIGNMARGALMGLNAPAIAELLDARVLLIARYESDVTVEEILLAHSLLGKRLAGVIFNFVREADLPALQGEISRYLEGRGIPVLGAVPKDPLLGGVTVRELADRLGAKVLCCDNRMDELIEHFVIGAMNVASAIKYFREIGDKAVITGGDRPDIQLAALQTPTRAIILSGNLYPQSAIIKRAQQVGVPLLVAAADTLSLVEEIERITGRLRIRERAKIDRALAVFDRHVNFDRLIECLGAKALLGAKERS